jgi:DNA polymerase IV
MSRSIIHIDITDFHISVERVLEPRLRQRPVAVAVETHSRSLVFASSQEARQSGVYQGMPLYQAVKNCPGLTVLPPNEELYSRATHAMMKVLGQFTPIFEPLRFGHAYMDMTGSGKMFGSIKDAAHKAQQEIRNDLRLDANAGLASNKLVSKAASDVITTHGELGSLCDVQRGHEENFLAPLRVGYLPGLQKKAREQLLDLNVRIIRELAIISSENLQMVFGRFGLLLHQRSRGIDNRPVQPRKKTPQIVEIEDFDDDTNDYFFIRQKVFRLLSQGTRRLREKNTQAGQMVLFIRYSDYKDDTAQQRFHPSNEDQDLFPIAADLLDRALGRRIRVRKITLKLNDLSVAPAQLSLFKPLADPRVSAVTFAMDKIRNRYGERAICFGRAA